MQIKKKKNNILVATIIPNVIVFTRYLNFKYFILTENTKGFIALETLNLTVTIQKCADQVVV